MMIKRILHFHKHDWKHIWWLFTRMVYGWWIGDGDLIVDAWCWIVIHVTFDSQLLPPDQNGSKK